MPLEEPSGSSVPSAPEEEEETVASKQTHILEQVTRARGPWVQLLVAQSAEVVQEERAVFAASQNTMALDSVTVDCFLVHLVS